MQGFKHKMVVDPEQNWKVLEQAIRDICNLNPTGVHFEELHRNVFQMVLSKNGERLYSGIEKTWIAHLRVISKLIQSAQGGSFLEELNRRWNEHNKAAQFIKDMTIYMEIEFVHKAKKTPVLTLGLNLWRDIVVCSNNIHGKLVNTLLVSIQKDRAGEGINRGLICNMIKMLMDLGETFSDQYVDFFPVESQELIERCDCGDYLKNAERRLNEEIERISYYFDHKPKLEITKMVERKVIHNLKQHLVRKNAGLVNMLLDDKYEDLKRMYNLFSRVDNDLKTIRNVMTSHIRETGKQFVTDPERVKNPVEFVQCLLDKKDKYDEIIRLAFKNDKTFQDVLKSSFEYFINLNQRSPEFISLYLDDFLHKGPKLVGESDVEVVLDKVIMLFRYLQEKDVFKKYYEQHLAYSLLSGKVVSDDAERSLIVKLGTECGHEFTSSLDDMLTDMRTTQNMIQEFYASHGAELGDGPTLVMRVLKTEFLPTQPCVPCNLPAELSLCEKFRSYYLGRNTGKRLDWTTNMGTADIIATFSKGQKHELNVSTFQMCVLMLFNNADKLSYWDISQATKIPDPELKRCLQSLACVEGKNVLQKESMSKDIGENDVFLFNDKFSSKSYNVKIGTIVVQVESESVRQETRRRVEVDRTPQIKATICRIMKFRKVLDYDNIIAKVTRKLQSCFLPNPVEIKKCIESLIEQEFLKRDSANRKLYRYLEESVS